MSNFAIWQGFPGIVSEYHWRGKKDLDKRVVEVEQKEDVANKRVKELEVQNNLLNEQLQEAKEKQLDIASFRNQALLL